MKVAENKEVKKGRDRYKDYMSQKYPDKVFDGENATDDLDELVASELEANASELEASRANNKKMVDMFNKFPRESRFFLRLASENNKNPEERANPISILLEMYGPDLLDAMQSEEGKALISEATAKYLEVKATEEAGEAERMANYEKSVQDIAAFAQEKGLTDEQAVAVFEKINQIGFDVIEGKYTREAMQMAYDAMNFSTAVESARKEGERDGRNAKIEEKLAKVNKPVDMPPAVGGQGATVPEPKAKVRDSFFDAQRDEVNRGYGRKSAFDK